MSFLRVFFTGFLVILFLPIQLKAFKLKQHSVPNTPVLTYTAGIFDPDAERLAIVGGVGKAGKIGQNLFYLLDLKKRKKGWRSMNLKGDKLPVGLRYHASTYHEVDHQVLLFGGTAGHLFNDKIFKINLNPGEEKVEELKYTGNGPGARFYHTITFDVVNNRLIMIGGRDKDSDVKNEIWVFDLMNGNERWYKMKFKGIEMPPLLGHTAVYDKRLSRIIIYGGMNDQTARLNTELFELSTKQGYETLSKIRTFPVPTGRQFHSAAFDPKSRKIFFFGGTDGFKALNDLYTYSVDEEEWEYHQLKRSPLTRYFHISVYSESFKKIYIFGGSDENLQMRQDFWSLEP